MPVFMRVLRLRYEICQYSLRFRLIDLPGGAVFHEGQPALSIGFPCEIANGLIHFIRVSIVARTRCLVPPRIYSPSIYVLYKSGIIEEERQTLVN